MRHFFSKDNIFVVGHPAIDTFIEEAQSTNQTEVRQKIGLLKNDNIVTLIGGYGQDYEKELSIFIEICQEEHSWQCLISPHPATTGELEKEYIHNSKAQNIKLNGRLIHTASVVKISAVVVNSCSTVGVQSLFIGVRSIDFEPPGGRRCGHTRRLGRATPHQRRSQK